MTLIRTDAVILRAVDYSESSKILTLLSPEHGRVAVIAKGAKRLKSPYRASVEVLARVEVIYSDKESRDVQTLSQCDLADAFPGMKGDLTAFAAASYLAEMAGAVAQVRQAAPELYAGLCAACTLLDHAPERAPGIAVWGARRLLAAAGLSPAVEACIGCGNPPAGEPRYFNPQAGGITCRRCHQAGSRPLKAPGYHALHAAGATAPEADADLAGVASALNALQEHVVYHMDFTSKTFAFLYDRLTQRPPPRAAGPRRQSPPARVP